MSPDTLPPPAAEPVENPGFRDLDPNGVIEQPFWERYNQRLEMPVSVAVAVLVFVAAGALIVYFMEMGGPNKKPVPMVFAGGDDDEGDGSPGGGGEQLAVGKPPSTEDLNKMLKDVPLKEAIEKEVRDKLDLGGDVEVSASDSVALAQLNDDLRNKLLGARSGTGKGTSGGNNDGGTGPGGFGASSTYARGLRWVIKFETSNGQDYINQIGGIGGSMLVPVPPDNKTLLYFKNPSNGQSTTATDADIQTVGGLIQFSEVNPDTVKAVAAALNLKFQPKFFYAYFPRNLEEKLAALEKNYQNKKPEQIRKTVFKVIVRGGSYDFVVTDQTLR